MTVADAVYDVINDNWGGGGYGGAAPSIDITESDVTTDNVKADVIEVRHYTLRESPKPVNDTYTNRVYFIDIFISSTTSAAQLKLIVDEVEYLLRNTAMTALQFVNVTKDYSVTKWMQAKHAVILKVELVSLMSSGAITPASSTGYNWHEAMMITSTYAAWVPLSIMGSYATSQYHYADGRLVNVGANDFQVTYLLGMPCLKGALKLYIASAKYTVQDADADDYIDTVTIYGVNGSTRDTIDTDATDHTSTGTKTFAGATIPASAVDVSSYDHVLLRFDIVATNALDFDLYAPSIQCYYDT